jgi:hypothetical protein
MVFRAHAPSKDVTNGRRDRSQCHWYHGSAVEAPKTEVIRAVTVCNSALHTSVEMAVGRDFPMRDWKESARKQPRHDIRAEAQISVIAECIHFGDA